MGHVLNPISMRLSINTLWNVFGYVSDKYEYNYLYTQDNNLKSFLFRFFDMQFFIKEGYLFSHVNILYFAKYYDIKVYLYRTIERIKLKKNKNINRKKRFLKRFKDSFKDKFSKVIIKYFYKNIYKTILLKIRILFTFFFFRYYIVLVSLKQNLLTKKINIFEFIKVLLLFLIKQKRFLFFFNIINFFLFYKKFKKYNRFNLFFFKMFFWFSRFKFWRQITLFLTYFLKFFLKVNSKIRICKLNYLGASINVIGAFLTKRLKQRFKILEIILPVMRVLKENKTIIGFKFSFCGRFSREEMATADFFSHAAVSLNTLTLFIEYLLTGVILKDSFCGLKIWLNKKKDNFIDLFFFSQYVIWKFLI